MPLENAKRKLKTNSSNTATRWVVRRPGCRPVVVTATNRARTIAELNHQEKLLELEYTGPEDDDEDDDEG